ncbi:MAG: hypothetical protein AAGD10_09445 [Myxococcota bacterium]
MLDAYIIESIREEQRRRETERDEARPRIHAPSPGRSEPHDRPADAEDDDEGPIVIPLDADITEEDAA